jgi:GrpB-like predicted nucleotidyltransferase (UPF0157 family)
MAGTVVRIEEYDASWPVRFAELGAAVRAAVGEVAVRIDHVGSTAVPGLAAKPIIDVQVSVHDFQRFDQVRAGLESLGLRWQADNLDRRKRFFHRREPFRVNVHVRVDGSVSQQLTLLFRDYLRIAPDARRRYEATKRQLATRTWANLDDYADAKGDTIWAIIRSADAWSWNGWTPGPSDA